MGYSRLHDGRRLRRGIRRFLVHGPSPRVHVYGRDGRHAEHAQQGREKISAEQFADVVFAQVDVVSFHSSVCLALYTVPSFGTAVRRFERCCSRFSGFGPAEAEPGDGGPDSCSFVHVTDGRTTKNAGQNDWFYPVILSGITTIVVIPSDEDYKTLSFLIRGQR